MAFHLNNILKTLLFLMIATAASAGVVYVLSYSSVELLSRDSKVLKADSYKDMLKDLKNNDVVEIEGTVNFLNLVEDAKSNYVYAGLKEFGSDVIVRIDKSKIKFESQKFIGKVMKLENDIFSKTLIDNLNKPIDFEDGSNTQLKNDFNEMTQAKIQEASKANFTNSAVLILDGEILDKTQLYTNIIIGFVLALAILLIFFRKRIFKIQRREEVAELSNE